jgi:putative membrane protein
MTDSPVNLSHWHTEPALIGGLLFVAWTYAILVGPFRKKICPELPYSRRHTFWFSAGLLSFYLAVGSPLDPLGENFLFFAHMIQHNILMYVSPLFLLLGIPQPLVDRFLETKPLVERTLRFFLHPIIAGLLFTLVFSFWHFGAFYEAAIQNKSLHMTEHLSMFFASVAMWWPICGPSKRIPPIHFGPQMLYILALMLGQTPIFAVLTFSEEVLYETYFYAERIINLSPIEDQKAGGVLMKLANMAVSIGVLSSVFYRWSKQQKAKEAM